MKEMRKYCSQKQKINQNNEKKNTYTLFLRRIIFEISNASNIKIKDLNFFY